MMKAFAIALVLAFSCRPSEDYDDTVPAADLADLGCKDPEGVKEEQEGIYEIDDGKCKMAPWTSSSTMTSRSFSSCAIRQPLLVRNTGFAPPPPEWTYQRRAASPTRLFLCLSHLVPTAARAASSAQL